MTNSPENSVYNKPNQLIAAIDQVKVSRLAQHLGDFFLRRAQEQINDEKYNGENVFSFPIREINEIAGIASKDYKLIQESLKALISPVTITDEDPLDIENDTKICYVALVSKIIVDSKAGLYTFKLEDEIIDLLKRHRYYTQLNLVEFNGLESKHSMKICKWLKRYETLQGGSPKKSVDYFRQLTNTTDKKSYNNFAQFQKWVLDVAVSEINEKTPYQVSYETFTTRTQRRPKVSEIKWNFKRKPVQSDVSDTSQGQNNDYHSRYADLAKDYMSRGFCETEADFYKATWVTDLKTLTWFYETNKDNVKLAGTKNKIKHLYKGIEAGKIFKRWPKQIEIYQWLLSRMREDDQKIMISKQAEQGFYEQIVFMKDYLQDPTPVKDPENWL